MSTSKSEADSDGAPAISLWTYQGAGFSLLDGKIGYRRSEFCQDCPGVRDAYKELYKRIGNRRVIWCLLKPRKEKWEWRGRLEWALRVPRSGVVKYLDTYVWERIAGTNAEPSRDWEEEAYRLFPGDMAKHNEYVDDQRREYRARKPPGDSWWNCALFDDPPRYATPILRHPVPESWVISNPLKGSDR